MLTYFNITFNPYNIKKEKTNFLITKYNLLIVNHQYNYIKITIIYDISFLSFLTKSTTPLIILITMNDNSLDITSFPIIYKKTFAIPETINIIMDVMFGLL